MKLVNVLYNKIYLFVLNIAIKFLTIPSQITFAGVGSTRQLSEHVTRIGIKKVLLVTDKILVELGVAQRVIDGIEGSGGEVIIYDGVLPDPTTDMVTTGAAQYAQNNCDGIIALGGGSSIDTAKGVAAAVNNGAIETLVGTFKIKKGCAPLFAIPTTSGTGSEVSVGAVLSDPVTHAKSVMIDPSMVPAGVALDPDLMLGMPKGVTAATGMDALTHAIETYVSSWVTDEVKRQSGTAVKLIFANLRTAYTTGTDVEARAAMATASYYAGLSLNISSVGNVHAIAHQLGSKYSIPHGLANAVVLPHVLAHSCTAMAPGLAELAGIVGIGDNTDSQDVSAKKFIAAVVALNEFLEIPKGFKQIKPADMAILAKDATSEGRTYPVPEVYGNSDVVEILKKIELWETP